MMTRQIVSGLCNEERFKDNIQEHEGTRVSLLRKRFFKLLNHGWDEIFVIMYRVANIGGKLINNWTVIQIYDF